MKLEILQENFSKAISLASRFTNQRAQLPILGNVLITVKKSKVIVSSTNLEVSTSIAIGAKVEEEGEITIPSKLINEIVSNLPKEALSLFAEKEQLKISTSGFSSTILGMNSSDFPKVPMSLNKESMIGIDKDALVRGLSQVSFAASSDETRPILTGVLFVWDKNELTLVATDGFRLSQKKLTINKSVISSQLVVPKMILSEISRLTDTDSQLGVEIKEKEKQCLFSYSNIVLSSRILEGDYPDYGKIIPKSSSLTVSVDKEDLLRAVKLASVFARDSANVVKLKITDTNIEISAESSNGGSQTTKIDSKTVKKEIPDKIFEITFNYRFLEEFLGSANGGEIRMEFTGQNSPGVFSDTSDSDYLHLIMPVKTQT